MADFLEGYISTKTSCADSFRPAGATLSPSRCPRIEAFTVTLTASLHYAKAVATRRWDKWRSRRPSGRIIEARRKVPEESLPPQ